MRVNTSLAAAALAATGATALNSHRHKHPNRQVDGAKAQQARALAERAWAYKHTETHVVTETEYVTLTIGPGYQITPDPAPTAAFFETASPEPSPEPTPEPVVEEPAIEEPVVEEPAVEEPAVEEPVVEETPTPAPETPAPESIPSSAPAPASAPTSAPASAPATGGGARPSCKRGISYNNPEVASQFTSSDKICWSYNWGSDPARASDVLYIPMLWGDKHEFYDVWDDNVEKAKATEPNLNILFSFNEPDLVGHGQAGDGPLHDASTAAADHIKMVGSKRPAGFTVGAPSITSDFNSPDRSWNWLSGFVTECDSMSGGPGTCPYDFVNTHYYQMGDAECPSDGFKEYITELGERFGKPIWVTELQALDCSLENQVRFINEVTAWMDGNDNVHGYAYFYGDGSLTDGVTPNSLGQAYMNA